MDAVNVTAVGRHPTTGSTLEGTSVTELSANIKTHRNCTVELVNHLTTRLEDPRSFFESGYCCLPLPPVIDPSSREAFAFSKTESSLRGAVGVFTYLVGGTNMRLAVMYSVPYDYNLSSNWFAIGFIPTDRPVDDTLYEEMYYSDEWSNSGNKERGQASNGATLHVEHGNLRADATMSDAHRAILKVNLTSLHVIPEDAWCGTSQGMFPCPPNPDFVEFGPSPPAPYPFYSPNLDCTGYGPYPPPPFPPHPPAAGGSCDYGWTSNEFC